MKRRLPVGTPVVITGGGHEGALGYITWDEALSALPGFVTVQPDDYRGFAVRVRIEDVEPRSAVDALASVVREEERGADAGTDQA